VGQRSHGSRCTFGGRRMAAQGKQLPLIVMVSKAGRCVITNIVGLDKALLATEIRRQVPTKRLISILTMVLAIASS